MAYRVMAMSSSQIETCSSGATSVGPLQRLSGLRFDVVASALFCLISSIIGGDCAVSQELSPKRVADFPDSDVFLNRDGRFVIAATSSTTNLQLLDDGVLLEPLSIPTCSGNIIAAFLSEDASQLALQRSNPSSIRFYEFSQQFKAFSEMSEIQIDDEKTQLIGVCWPGIFFLKIDRKITIETVDRKIVARVIAEKIPERGFGFSVDSRNGLLLMIPGEKTDGEVMVVRALVAESEYGRTLRRLEGYSHLGICAAYATQCDFAWENEHTITAHVINVPGNSCPESSAIFIWTNGALLDIKRLGGFFRCHSLRSTKGKVAALLSPNSSNALAAGVELEAVCWDFHLKLGLHDQKRSTLQILEDIHDIVLSTSAETAYALSEDNTLYKYDLD